MKYIFAALLTSLSSFSMAAPVILADGIIYNVGNSNGAGNGFAIFVKSTNTTVPCPEGFGITFLASTAPSEKAYDRSFTVALAAQMAGKRVIVYGNGTVATGAEACGTAVNISVINQ